MLANMEVVATAYTTGLHHGTVYVEGKVERWDGLLNGKPSSGCFVLPQTGAGLDADVLMAIGIALIVFGLGIVFELKWLRERPAEDKKAE